MTDERRNELVAEIEVYVHRIRRGELVLPQMPLPPLPLPPVAPAQTGI